ncbi:MAG: S41 family peptidase [Bdellovibrionales bacterium]|jgi:carboxyl-terminal processing protease|nr:S41 family peptidase [Bdellovibrionales bacterium]
MVKRIFIVIMLFSFTVTAQEKSRFEKMELFNKVLYLIESQYYRDVDIDKLIQGALKGMMNTLDPHSSYLPEKVFEKMQEDTKGEFGGLGIEVTQKDGMIVVIAPIEDSPAFKAGIKPGDKIVEINHDSVLGLNLEDAVDKMRGKPGTKILIGVSREGEDKVLQINLTREVIKVKPVKVSVLDKNYFYIRLSSFQKNSSNYIRKEIKKFKKKSKLNGLIIDLRSNPGGLLDEAVNVSSLFLKEGIVVSTESRDPKNKEIRYVMRSGEKELKAPLIVLIDGASASASEIVAGALQDHGRAIIMGTRSFGKGSVQSVAKIDEKKGVKLTIAQYMTPKGRRIQALGITPDVEVGHIDKPVDELIKEPAFIREKDLRGHLTATIETEEEKKLRLKEEKRERLKRIEKIKASKEKKESKKRSDPNNRKYEPSKDYQVVQALNVLKSLYFTKKPKN